jgi:hypothetical protein
VDSEETDVTMNTSASLPAGEYHFNNLTITNNTTLTLLGDTSSANSFKGVKIVVNNLTIDNGSSISADYKGYAPDQGPGASSVSGAGASYGADNPSDSVDLVYGSAIYPVDLGSGGVHPHYGGGAMRIIVHGMLNNNGSISADGGTSGSGGSILVTTQSISGNGALHANGGNLFAGGFLRSPGTGGRVAIHYGNSSFTGTVEANGGSGSYDGMTAYYSPKGTAGLFDETNNNLYINNSWQFRSVDSPLVFNDIFVSNGVSVRLESGATVTADDFYLDEVSTLTLIGGENINANNLFIKGNSIVTVNPEIILALTVSNINIESGSSILADGKGYKDGPGTPDVYGQVGASYGGLGGGTDPKPTYGSDIAPVDFGSGTGGNRGGGAIRLIVSGTLQNDGLISVVGAGGATERVSGGSIYVTAGHLLGGGSFNANGGDGSWPYMNMAGGGGRIAIYYQDSFFSGTATASAGRFCYSGCFVPGTDGTVIMEVGN